MMKLLSGCTLRNSKLYMKSFRFWSAPSSRSLSGDLPTGALESGAAAHHAFPSLNARGGNFVAAITPRIPGGFVQFDGLVQVVLEVQGPHAAHWPPFAPGSGPHRYWAVMMERRGSA